MESACILPLIAENRGPVQAVRALVGVDGGGTRTRVRIAGLDGRVLGEGSAGPSALGQGVAQAWQHIGEALQQAAARGGLAPLRWEECAVGAGLSGASVEVSARAFIAANPGCAQLVLDTDGFVGVLGAHGGAAGALLVGGTGSVCTVLRSDGGRTCVGGWGWAVGDEGSGAWLGKEAVRHAQRALDGRDAAGPLAQAVWQCCGVGADVAEALCRWGVEAGQHAFASLAPIVFEHERDDPVARRLLDEAARELEALARAADPRSTLPLALAGSVALRVADRFSPSMRARCTPAQADAVSGALQLVRGELDRTIEA